MPRNVDRTRRLLREAAAVEFAEHGLDGTTVERIAARAGVNKERLYNYFGDKASLFSNILTEELSRIADAVPLRIDSLEDVAEFSAQSFDYVADHPDLGRLVIWEGLSDIGGLPDETARTALYRRKVEALSAAQDAKIITRAIPAPDLLFLLLSLSSWWASAPQIARMISGTSNPRSARVERRAAVAAAARRLATPDEPPPLR